jgi:hypothetical protein
VCYRGACSATSTVTAVDCLLFSLHHTRPLRPCLGHCGEHPRRHSQQRGVCVESQTHIKMSAVQFPTVDGTEAGQWCPTGNGDGTHIPFVEYVPLSHPCIFRRSTPFSPPRRTGNPNRRRMCVCAHRSHAAIAERKAQYAACYDECIASQYHPKMLAAVIKEGACSAVPLPPPNPHTALTSTVGATRTRDTTRWAARCVLVYIPPPPPSREAPPNSLERSPRRRVVGQLLAVCVEIRRHQ